MSQLAPAPDIFRDVDPYYLRGTLLQSPPAEPAKAAAQIQNSQST
jgi:hypothetical protein